MKYILNLILVVVLLLCNSITLFAQTNYVQQGDEYFARGDYERAIRNYNVAKDLENISIDDKLSNAEACKTLLNKGNEYFFAGEYAFAKSYYQRVLQQNSSDPNMAGKIAACDNALQNSKTDTIIVEKPTQQGTVKLQNQVGVPLVADGYKIIKAGQEVSENEVKTLLTNASQYNSLALYEKGLSQHNTAIILNSLSLLPITGGALTLLALIESKNPNGIIITSASLVAGGVALIVTGGILNSTAKKNIKKAVLKYNTKDFTANLSFGMTLNGVGFTILF